MSEANIVFVCWGNICRSPMAAVVAQAYAAREGVQGVKFTSAGVSSEEAGNPMDPRAVAVLAANGYRPAPHQAHKVSAAELEAAAIVIGMERLHLRKIQQLAPDVDPLFLLSDFDPETPPGAPIEDPWYGDDADFVRTLREIEAAMPCVIKRVKELD